MSTNKPCDAHGEILRPFAQCSLPMGHDGPHSTDGGAYRWWAKGEPPAPTPTTPQDGERALVAEHDEGDLQEAIDALRRIGGGTEERAQSALARIVAALAHAIAAEATLLARATAAEAALDAARAQVATLQGKLAEESARAQGAEAERDHYRGAWARVRPVVEAAREQAKAWGAYLEACNRLDEMNGASVEAHARLANAHAEAVARTEALVRSLPAATPPTTPVGLDMICALDYLADDCSIATIGKHQRRFHGCTLTDEQIAAALAATEAP